MRDLHVSHVSSALDTAPRSAIVTWDALCRRLTRPPPVRRDLTSPDPAEARARKARLPAWIPARFTAGARRCSDGVADVHLLVLDYDDGSAIINERSRWAAYAHCGHTSWSHAESHHKFRIVIPLAQPVAPHWWARVFEWAQREARGKIDACTRNPDRLYYLPALQSAAQDWFSWVHDGPWLDLEGPELPATALELDQQRRADAMRHIRERRPHTDATREDARQARLLREDPDTRASWAVARGASIRPRTSGRIAIGLTCPACGERSAWIAVDVVRATGARCNHQRTCGWVGPLSEIP